MRKLWSSGAWGVLAAIGMIGWIAFSQLSEDRRADRAPFKAIYRASETEEAVLTTLLGEAFGVLRSPQFHENLLSLLDRYPVVYARPDDQAASLTRVARIVAAEGAFTRYAPADVYLTGGDDQMDPERDGGSAGQGQGLGRYAEINLGRNVIDRYRSPNLVMQSCAINVAAHEYAHTISTTPLGFGIAFTDTNALRPAITDRQHPGTPVGSYLIGAVAQCTWLQMKGRIGRSEVAACVETFGVNAFNWQRCNQFASDQMVGPRPGLPAPSPSL